MLAAIGKVESDHGRVRLPGVRSGSNWAGACGPMQIGCVPGSKAGNSWARYGHGRPHDPANAIPAAARYLVDHGARRNLDRAIYAYNHSRAYVAKVKQLARRYRPRGWAAMTATADRFGPGRSREELRLVELASGLLLLLDAHRLTGRLPLEVQVQTSRLRHAVKLAVQAEAARTAALPPTPPPAASRDQAAALRAWIAAQPWVQPGPVGWVYLLCFRDPSHRPPPAPPRQRLFGASTPATTGAGPTTSSAASPASTATPAGAGPAGWSRSPSPPG